MASAVSVEQIVAFRTSDGKTFDVLQDAEAHAKWLAFLHWCEANICRGGEWDSKMVAEAIWNEFYVERKSK